MDKKNWWKSKTIIFNLAVATFIYLQSVIGVFQAYIPSGIYTALLLVVTVTNVALRFATTIGIKFNS